MGTAEENWTRTFEVDGETFTATFIRRPFREGLEVRVVLEDQVISVAEFGFGERALLEKATSLVRDARRKR